MLTTGELQDPLSHDTNFDSSRTSSANFTYSSDHNKQVIDSGRTTSCHHTPTRKRSADDEPQQSKRRKSSADDEPQPWKEVYFQYKDGLSDARSMVNRILKDELLKGDMILELGR